MKIDTDNTGQPIYCKRCGKPQGVLKFDGQVFAVGNIEIYNSVRYSCAGCHYPITFFPKEIEDARKGFTRETKRILNALGERRKDLSKGE